MKSIVKVSSLFAAFSLLLTSCSLGAVEIKDYAGESVLSARIELTELGLDSTTVEEPSQTDNPGTILRTDPPAGSVVPLGSMVTLFISERVSEVPKEDLSWVPNGFEAHNNSIAYKFTTNKGAWPCQNCNFWKVTVYANKNCSSGVYAELNMMDSYGSVQDWTNDSIPFLARGQKAVLKFTNYPFDSNLESGQLIKLTCRG
jgi:hypothetical protein